MEHIVFGYKLLLLILGIVTLFITFLARNKRNYIKYFTYFYLVYVLILLLDLTRSYLIISSFWESAVAIFVSYAITLFFNYLLVIFCYILGKEGIDRRSWGVFSILILFLIIIISPLSVSFNDRNKTATVTLYYYISLLPLVITGIISGLLNFKKIRMSKSKPEMIFFTSLTLFIAFFTTETTISLIYAIINPVTTIGVVDKNVQFSTIPYLVLSVTSINFFLSMIFKPKSVKVAEDFKSMGYSGRESEILLLVIKGYSYKKIGEELSISLSTVKTHMTNIFKKAHVNSRFELLKKIE